MREAPVGVAPADVLAAVRRHWLPGAVAVTHLPVGFGAHHWRADGPGGPALFVTLDSLGARHDLAGLRAAYSSAAALAERLDFVVAPLVPYVVAFGAGALSATPWLPGPAVGDGPLTDLEGDAVVLGRLHEAAAPAGTPVWRPLVPADLADRLRDRLAVPWDTGPHGPTAREALLRHLDDVARWTRDYHRLAEEARTRRWVPTHGEPHTRNQVRLPDGRAVLVDWESLKVAPRERDLRGFVDAGRADLVDPHPPMVELFDLEWRLDEVDQYAAWFAAPHTGTASDEVAVSGLLAELERP
ncbi:phosphotransferase family protein [uncultured Nocardioides sp.]|uniref:Aminoglycoside phosphotransferase domain-containing protein n=1 Tax=uncultured Nocardioides sp. TaxID=198441 RepID=A0A6J4N7H9_9ACTN|nr:hypothetical protein [uncultured Nocardioides sp.]CAA9376330.1 MAG: hypothetical protein AVDCRST_MAG06-540 [uncultured Nocardioides sp.]